MMTEKWKPYIQWVSRLKCLHTCIPLQYNDTDNQQTLNYTINN